MAATNIFDRALSEGLNEVVSETITFAAENASPFWSAVALAGQGEVDINKISENYEVIKTFAETAGGVIRPDHNRDALVGGNTPIRGLNLYGNQANNPWPNPLAGTGGRVYPLGIPIKSLLTNIDTSFGEALIGAAPFSVDPDGPIMRKLNGHAAMIGNQLCSYWFSEGADGGYELDTVASTSEVALDDLDGTDVDVTGLWITLTNQNTHRFYIGQQLDIALNPNQSGDVQRNDVSGVGVLTAYVDDVDHFNARIRVVFVLVGANGALTFGDPGSGGNISISQGDSLLSAGSDNGSGTYSGMQGLNDWIKTTGNLLGSGAVAGKELNVDSHSRFRSLEKAINGNLTRSLLTRYLSIFDKGCMSSGHRLDTMFIDEGVILNYVDQVEGREQLMTTPGNATLTLAGEGFDGRMEFVHAGQRYNIIKDYWVRAGELVGAKLGGGNWKRVVPPDITGFTNDPSTPNQIPFRFVGSLTHGSNKIPLDNVAGTFTSFTGSAQMPGIIRQALYPEDPRMLKLTGLTRTSLDAELDS